MIFIAQVELQGLLDRFLVWSNANKLTLNAHKTKTMTFLSPKSQNPNYVKLKEGDLKLEKVYDYKYLGYLLGTC